MVQKSSLQGFIPVTLIVLCLSAFVVCSCKKSKEAEYDEWAEKGTELLKTVTTNWTSTNGYNSQTNAQILSGMDKLGNTIKSDATKEKFMSMNEAMKFLVQLHDSDRLPGIAKDEHGHMDCDVPIMVSNKLVSAAYPIRHTFHCVKDDCTSTNNFIVVKDSKNAEWKLVRAWETDSKGQTIQEWPIK